MQNICGKQPLLGALLVEHGAVRLSDVEFALNEQVQTGKRLGDTLVELGLLSRPSLARALSGQLGVELEEERGFGMGLRGKIEDWHLARRGLQRKSEETSEPEAIGHDAPQRISSPPKRMMWEKSYLY
jgi:hypothetical protein